MSFNRILALVPTIALVAACASQPAATPVSVADTIARDPELSTLNSLVVKAGLADTLKAQGPYTVFAPTNEAFKAVPAKTMDDLAKDPAKLKAVLTYHVVPSQLTSSQVKTQNVKSAQGANLALSKAGDFVTVEDAMVTHADVMATNGVVHSVDRVLMPPR
ncbi:fasciclin domain-containing protein [Caenimonas koreensis]|uniref:Fasciclin domain-containing protein n=1 Tax=Caenimonas koreensis DSM 17982 TaxID=1121255 RepID=A0A844B0A3_9BURK|nr:fasciclin domain-containing protein [Caenimonas koreensis]MRD48128.1 fasciclin domain-containing protein [Caenimonas koreensis DSM 17982]